MFLFPSREELKAIRDLEILGVGGAGLDRVVGVSSTATGADMSMVSGGAVAFGESEEPVGVKTLLHAASSARIRPAKSIKAVPNG